MDIVKYHIPFLLVERHKQKHTLQHKWGKNDRKIPWEKYQEGKTTKLLLQIQVF